jgi:monoterpene epsilon-lactone hydrolase
MTSSSAERKVRAWLPVLRLLPAYMPLAVIPWLLKQAVAHWRPPADVAVEAVLAEGVPCKWLISENNPQHQVLLYLHGGGFVFGLTPQHMRMGAYLGQRMRIPVLMVDYRVGPDHPFPAASDDCVAVYHWLLKQGIRAQDIVMAGDSAGGNLVITTMMRLRDGHEPLPAAAACLSPVADLSGSRNPSKIVNDPVLHPKAMTKYDAAYVGHSDPRDPLISPALGDWRGLPPLLIHAGEDEFLREDALRIEELAKVAGVDVRLATYPRMWHVWQLYLAVPYARQSLDDIARFLKSHLAHRAP